MVIEIQLCANGAKNTMSPSKHKKRRSTKPKEMYIPDVVVIPPAARSKHLFDDFTKKQCSQACLIQVSTKKTATATIVKGDHMLSIFKMVIFFF